MTSIAYASISALRGNAFAQLQALQFSNPGPAQTPTLGYNGQENAWPDAFGSAGGDPLAYAEQVMQKAGLRSPQPNGGAGGGGGGGGGFNLPNIANLFQGAMSQGSGIGGLSGLPGASRDLGTLGRSGWNGPTSSFGPNAAQNTCNVPWISQADPRVPGHDNPNSGHWNACYRAVSTMAAQAGVHLPGSPGSTSMAARTPGGKAYLDSQLAQNRPVGARVDHNGRGHYVLINGRGVDANGRQFYTYLDPGTLHRDIGADPNRNRLYYNPATGGFHKTGVNEHGYAYQQSYDVTNFIRSS
jgi:hypothetical protein